MGFVVLLKGGNQCLVRFTLLTLERLKTADVPGVPVAVRGERAELSASVASPAEQCLTPTAFPLAPLPL